MLYKKGEPVKYPNFPIHDYYIPWLIFKEKKDLLSFSSRLMPFFLAVA